MNRNLRLLINGALHETESCFEVLNPSTGLAFASAPNASAAQVQFALSSAKSGFKVWSKICQSDRRRMLLHAAEILETNRSKIENLLVLEQGKPLASAVAEMNGALSSMRSCPEVLPEKIVKETPTHLLKVRHVPLGVVVGITPWNYPLSLGCGKIARALSHGNSIVLKPSPFTPLTSLLVGELLVDVFPPGVLNVISGSDDISPSIGQQLVESPAVSLVSFTGSVPTGKRIMASCASNMTRVLLELGGNDPAIVLADADVPETAKGVFAMAMANSGQICCAIKRVYVHESVYDEFVDCVVELAKNAQVGNGMDPKVQYGPLNNKAQLERVKMLVDDAVNKKAKIMAGKCPENGYFFPPTILTNVSDGMRIVDEEQFGPVMPVLKYSTVEEVIERANASKLGLGASVWGRDPSTLNLVASQLEAGFVWTNQHAVLREGAPFGGMKQSGFRREGDGAECDLDAYTEVQSIKLAKMVQ